MLITRTLYRFSAFNLPHQYTVNLLDEDLAFRLRPRDITQEPLQPEESIK